MEQKKILWVILSVSLFVLVIFGIALFLYSPSRNSAIAEAGGELVPYEENTHTNSVIDPDMWARNPDTIAALDKNAPAAVGNIIQLNNIISTGGQSSQNQSIDVSDLTEQNGKSETAGLPKELAEQIGIEPEQLEQTIPQESTVQKKAVPQPKKSVEKKPVVKNAPVKTKPQAPKMRAPKNTTKPQKPKTLYWVQTASFASRINAERARDTLAAQHMKVEIFTRETAAGLTHRVRVGPFNNNTEAKYWLKNIRKIEGFEGSYVSEEKLK